jgi:hypothetical protein
MKRFLTLALVGALVLGVSSVVYANVCAFDAAPAATLLFPFVTYNYDLGFDGYNTLFAITNVSSEATIAHVTVWTDFSVAILDFNILLTGYDVQTLSIRDILKDGKLPVTTIAGHTTQEGINDDGPISESNSILPWDFTQPLDEPEATSVLSADARCTTGDSAYPGRYATPIPPQILELFKGWLQSSQTATWKHSDFCSFGGAYTLLPAAWMYERTTADDTWMYITVDVVETCNKTFPDEIGYWLPAPGGEARYDNILIGDVIWLNDTERLSEAFLRQRRVIEPALFILAGKKHVPFDTSSIDEIRDEIDDKADFRSISSVKSVVPSGLSVTNENNCLGLHVTICRALKEGKRVFFWLFPLFIIAKQ